MITEFAIVTASSGIETAELDGEAVLLDVNTGRYYGLSSVGAKIMELLGEPVPIHSIIDRLITEYAVERERLSEDIITFLSEMNDRSLIQVVNGEVA